MEVVLFYKFFISMCVCVCANECANYNNSNNNERHKTDKNRSAKIATMAISEYAQQHKYTKVHTRTYTYMCMTKLFCMYV